MTSLSEINLNLSDEDLIAALAQGNPGAAVALSSVLKYLQGIHSDFSNPDTAAAEAAREFRAFAVDVIDMRMSGPQIWVAYRKCALSDPDTFVIDCAERNPDMIKVINSDPDCSNNVAREHGEQQTIPAIDGAVRRTIEDAEKAGRLQRIDEGAEAVNRLFVAMLTDMQARGQFVTNIRINLGLEGGEWGVFAIHFVEILDRDGKPIQVQPTDEVANDTAPADISAMGSVVETVYDDGSKPEDIPVSITVSDRTPEPIETVNLDSSPEAADWLKGEREGERGAPDTDIDPTGNYYPGRETTGEDNEAAPAVRPGYEGTTGGAA